MIKQKELKEILNYDPETGLFTWTESGTMNRPTGVIAGTKHKGYILIGVSCRVYRAHRLAWLYMTGVWPKAQIDHKDRVRDNNRWLNLQEATNTQNQKNKSLYPANKSGVNGVCWHKKDKAWRAKISNKSKPIHLGNFEDKFEAICARMSANNKYGYSVDHGR